MFLPYAVMGSSCGASVSVYGAFSWSHRGRMWENYKLKQLDVCPVWFMVGAPTVRGK